MTSGDVSRLTTGNVNMHVYVKMHKEFAVNCSGDWV